MTKINVEKISETSFYNPDTKLDENTFYIVEVENGNPYLGVANGAERINTGILSGLLNDDCFAYSAANGLLKMESGEKEHWSFKKGGEIIEKDLFSTVYRTPEFNCGGYADEYMALILKKEDGGINALLIKPGEERYTVIESKIPCNVPPGINDIEDVLRELGLGKLVDKDKKDPKYIIA